MTNWQFFKKEKKKKTAQCCFTLLIILQHKVFSNSQLEKNIFNFFKMTKLFKSFLSQICLIQNIPFFNPLQHHFIFAFPPCIRCEICFPLNNACSTVVDCPSHLSWGLTGIFFHVFVVLVILLTLCMVGLWSGCSITYSTPDCHFDLLLVPQLIPVF